MPRPWEPSFGTFHAWLEDDSIVVVTVDRAARAGIGLDHPVFFGFVIDLKAPNENGLISSEERPHIEAFEQAVEAALADKGEPWLVGWRNEKGKRYVSYYLPEGMPKPDLGQSWPHGYRLRYRVARDPDWKEYRDNLAPTPFQEILIDSNRQIFQLHELGDDSSAVRTVDHTVLFPDSSSAEGGAEALRTEGFTVVSVNGGVVACTKQHDLSIRAVEVAVGQILFASEPLGGRYDGWGAPIVAPETHSQPRRRGLFRR